MSRIAKQTDAVRDIIIETLQRGGTLKVFANSRYQDISEISFDGCGGVVLKLDEVKPQQTFEEVMADHAAHCATNHQR